MSHGIHLMSMLFVWYVINIFMEKKLWKSIQPSSVKTSPWCPPPPHYSNAPTSTHIPLPHICFNCNLFQIYHYPPWKLLFLWKLPVSTPAPSIQMPPLPNTYTHIPFPHVCTNCNLFLSYHYPLTIFCGSFPSVHLYSHLSNAPTPIHIPLPTYCMY